MAFSNIEARFSNDLNRYLKEEDKPEVHLKPIPSALNAIRQEPQPAEILRKQVIPLNQEQREMIRRVTRADQQDLACLMRELKLTPEIISTLREGQWKSSCLEDQCELYALKAYLAGEISRDRLCQWLLFQAAVNETGNPERVRCVRFQNAHGELNHEAVTLFRASIENRGVLITDRAIEEKIIEKFLERVLEVSPEVSDFFIIERTYRKDPLMCAFKKLNHNYFCIPNQADRSKYSFLVFSPQLGYEFLKSVHFSEYHNDPVAPNPVLGLSKMNDFANAAQRDVFIPCTHILPYESLSFYYHDLMYHLFIETLASKEMRQSWIEIAQLFDERIKEELEIKNTLLDREFLKNLSLFIGHPDVNQTNNELFWITFQLALKKHLTDPGALEKVLSHIKKNQERWKSDYGIDFESRNEVLSRIWPHLYAKKAFAHSSPSI
jgi:hypothetical protein